MPKTIQFETRLTSCLMSEDVDLVTVEVKLRGADITDPVTKKVTPGTGTKVETFRVRPVTDGERAKARREASTGRQTLSVSGDADKGGLTRSVSQELNAEMYNTLLLFYALGGDRVFGTGEYKEGWSLVDKNGDPLPVKIDTVRANVHPGIVSKLVDVVVEQSNITPASEKN
jgi:hypothetical protein